mgnify:FL=1
MYIVFMKIENRIYGWEQRRMDFFLLTPKNENNYEVTQYIPREDDSYSISSNSVYSILQDSKGRMWIGTWGGGINLIDHSSENGHIRFIHSRNILNNYPIHVCEKVRCLYEAENGVVLIGTTGGIASLSFRIL